MAEQPNKQMNELVGLAIRANQLIPPGGSIVVTIPQGKIITSGINKHGDKAQTLIITKPTITMQAQLQAGPGPNGGKE